MKFKFFCFSACFLFLLSSYGRTFDEFIADIDKQNLTCKDASNFLKENGVDVKQNIIHLSELEKFKKKPTGHSKGSIYQDAEKTVYYVKKCNIFNEIMGSKLMNLIIGTQISPVVKIVKNRKNMVASQKIESFRMKKTADTYDKKIINEVLVRIAMDFLGLVDRNPRNMGYKKVSSRTLSAARVDFDACFDFESKKGYTSKTNHLSLKHLRRTLKIYPKEEIINAMRKIVAISDETLNMTIFEAWAALVCSGSKIKYERCFELSKKLIERKNIFREALEVPESSAYKLLHKKFKIKPEAKTDNYNIIAFFKRMNGSK